MLSQWPFRIRDLVTRGDIRRSVTRGRSLSVTTVCLALLTCSACGTSPATPHALFSDDIAAMMKRIDRLAYERELTDQQIEAQRKAEAALLASSTRELADALENRGRNAEFSPYITALRTHAVEIEAAATGRGTTSMAAVFDALNDTCQSCHHQFRVGGGR
ncbi:MAG: cytochrome c [Pseudomonadales bacterium]|nr:cytochrome c [Pseudomonadales bacterium]